MSATGNIRAVAGKELRSYFASPVAYVFLVMFLITTGFFTFMLGGFFNANEASLQAFFMWHPWLYMLLVPAVGMRLWAEERKSGTIELLFTLPITPWQAILGKYLAGGVFMTLALALTFPMLITVFYLGDPDFGALMTGYLGSLLVAWSFLAVSCLTSSFTRNQVVSFILSDVACFVLILAGYRPITELVSRWAGPDLVDFVAAFSTMPHFETLQRGVVDLRGIVYFLSLIGFALFSTAVVLRTRRA